MASSAPSAQLSLTQFFALFYRILTPERSFYWLAIVYGVGISLLSLALPISVQMLINTVANTALTTPLVVLSLTLFGLLLISGLLNALRIHLMEIFGRRFYARMVAEIALRSIYAQNPFFHDAAKGSLFNRYFDIIIVQKTMPILFIGGFTVILQAAVGFVLVSFYHPLFLGFNLVVIALIWAIWLIWGASAIRNGMELSHKKHKTAAWLEGLGGSNGFFKSQRNIDYALDQTDAQTEQYITQHKRYFRRHFAQTVAFLVLYAAASASLLGLGGWLVIQGQLTLGQLVAAELVLSAAFFGVSQLGTYLSYFYDLCASVEELSLFLEVEQEDPVGKETARKTDPTLEFVDVRGDARGRPARLNLEIPGGSIVMASASNHGVQRLFANLLKRHAAPQGGYILFGGSDILSAEVHVLRQHILVLDRPSTIETTIREYLELSCNEASAEHLIEALELVGLAPAVAELEDGLDTSIAATGWPLSVAELLQLKLAGALLARPNILILSQLFDIVDEERLSDVIAALRRDPTTTLIYFSNRRVDLGFDTYLHLENERQTFYDDIASFDEARRRGDEPPASPKRLGADKLKLIGEG